MRLATEAFVYQCAQCGHDFTFSYGEPKAVGVITHDFRAHEGVVCPDCWVERGWAKAEAAYHADRTAH